MPELPEVETVKRGLAKSIVGKQIAGFDCDAPKLINKSIKAYGKTVNGLKIIQVRRRAKMLIIQLSKGWNILVHLKMTGQLVYKDNDQCVVGGHPIDEGFTCLPNKFTRVIFTFSDGSALYYNDVRKFGWLRLYADEELTDYIQGIGLGVEPLSAAFSLNHFRYLTRYGRTRKRIKQFLMENHNLVGVGNIYSDEICFYARVKPDRAVKTLTDLEVKSLYQGVREILKAAIKAKGTTFRDYRDADGRSGGFTRFLQVYQRYGQKCLRCKGEVTKMKLGGRTASFCPQCQN